VCPPGDSPRPVVEEAVARTTRWARRALATPRPEGQALFGIVQGACFADLRRAHADELGAMPFDGLALGGFSVGEPVERMHATLAEVATALDAERPRYLMGVGTPRDLVVAIGAGVDMFDCVLPTRNGRHGLAFTRFGPVNLKNARHAEDARPIDAAAACAAARDFSRAYLHHLVRANEMLGAILLTTINLAYYQELMAAMRAAISAGTFADVRAAVREGWARGGILAL
jgi:queuine tRNA-ribosyltransferase